MLILPCHLRLGLPNCVFTDGFRPETLYRYQLQLDCHVCSQRALMAPLGLSVPKGRGFADRSFGSRERNRGSWRGHYVK